MSIIALLLERYKKINNKKNKKVFNIELFLVFELFKSRKINEIIIRKSKILMKFSLLKKSLIKNLTKFDSVHISKKY